MASRAYLCRDAGRLVHAAVFEVHVGRIRLILLDTRVPQNAPRDAALTARSTAATSACASSRSCCWAWRRPRPARPRDHGERLPSQRGHSAFALLERARQRIQSDGMDPIKPARGGFRHRVHHPYPRGRRARRFPADLAAEHLQSLADGLKLPLDESWSGTGEPPRPWLALPPHGAGAQAVPAPMAFPPCMVCVPQDVEPPYPGARRRPFHRTCHQRRPLPPGWQLR